MSTVLYDGEVHVHYGFVYLDSGVGGWDQEYDQRAGQSNGLLGAAQPGFLMLVTGTHTGSVPLRVEWLEEAPTVDASGDEVVEASCDLRGPEVVLSAFEWWTEVTLPQSGPHRARLSVWGFEAGRDGERYELTDPVLDRYLLQLWPSPMAADQIIKATGETAAYWHQEARSARLPTTSPHQQALAEQLQARQRAEQIYARQLAEQRADRLERWGGVEPTALLERVEEHAVPLAREHRDLVDAIVELAPERQRELAVAVMTAACAADDGPVDWHPAVEALTAGHPLPPPFDDREAMQAAIFGPHATFTAVITTMSSPGFPPPRRPIHTGVTADAAVRAAAHADPLVAALTTVTIGSWSAPELARYYADIAARIRRLAP